MNAWVATAPGIGAFDFGASSEQGMAEEQTKAESTARLCEQISELGTQIRELEDSPDDISGEADRLGRAMTSAIAESVRSAGDILGPIADGALRHLERESSGKASRMNPDDRVLATGWVAALRALGPPA